MRVIHYSPKTLVKVPNVFGNGSDGAVTFAVNTTLTGDVNGTVVTINAGITVTTGGFRIFATQAIFNRGTLSCIGLPGSDTGIAGGPLGGGHGTLPGGCDPFYNNTLNAAVPSLTPSGHFGTLSAAGGASGNDNLSRNNAGGSRNAGFGSGSIGLNVVDALHVDNGSDDVSSFHTGAIAAGGTGYKVSGFGYASGGGGGGIILLSAPRVDNTLGTIDVHGGAGQSVTYANTGGGGGGAGGVILCIGDVIVQGTIVVSGGAGGTGGTGGTAGSAGGAGQFISIRSS